MQTRSVDVSTDTISVRRSQDHCIIITGEHESSTTVEQIEKLHIGDQLLPNDTFEYVQFKEKDLTQIIEEFPQIPDDDEVPDFDDDHNDEEVDSNWLSSRIS